MSSNMIRRVAVAAVGIPAALGVVYLGGWALAGLLAVFGVIGTAEVYRLAERGGVRAVPGVGYAAAALLPLSTYLAVAGVERFEPRWFVLTAALWIMVVMAIGAWIRRPGDRPLAAMAVTVFGALYAGGLLSFILLLRYPPTELQPWGATWLVFLPLVLTWVCDSLAMAGGSMIGGPKLAPVLSPNKTWAGAISGSLGAAVLAPLYGWVVLDRVGVILAAWQLALLGLVVSVVGQAGDVVESLLKREVGAKDSGAFFPGHGGVLDRFDSLYWTIPTTALLLIVYGTV